MTAVKRLMTGRVSFCEDLLTVLEYRELTNNAPEGILAGKDILLRCLRDLPNYRVKAPLMSPIFLNGNVISLDRKERHLKAAYSLPH